MQAYNSNNLYNEYAEEQATEAMETSCITKEAFQKIIEAYPNKLYTPNYFIRIALGLLTIIAIVFFGALLWLFTSASSNYGIIILLIFQATICYVALEFLVNRKQYYNAGIDNVLMFMVISFIVSAFFVFNFEISWVVISAVIMTLALWFSIRFTDAFYGCNILLQFICFYFFDLYKRRHHCKNHCAVCNDGGLCNCLFFYEKYAANANLYLQALL